MRVQTVFPNHEGGGALVGVAALVLLMLAGCAGSGQGRSSYNDPNVITQAQIQETGTTSNAYTLVRRLRPNWLRKHGRSSITSPGTILVYVDGSRYGPVANLRALQVVNIASLSFLNAAQATTRFGSGHENGIIMVKTK